MSKRYFVEEDGKAKGSEPEIFNITSSQINKAKKHADFKTREAKRNLRPFVDGKGPDPFPGKAPIDPETLANYERGEGVNLKKVKTKYGVKSQARQERNRELASELAARSELLLTESEGFLEGDDVDEFTGQVTQTQIKRAVDEESAAKGFDLNLQQFGPYHINYTRNGRHLVIGGRRGHVAAFEWISKKLLCEINVQDEVNDVQWLHTEHMFAVAQRKWTYIYDNQGIEIHCLKTLDNIRRLEFLPFHFLLASLSEKGFLSWVDVSVGKMVAQFPTREGRSSDMVQNPWNACLCLSHPKGIVSLWTPNVREPVAKFLAHRQAVTSLAVDKTGTYMATAGIDRSVKIWDIRQFKCLQDYRVHNGPRKLAFSGNGLLAIATQDEVDIFKDCCQTATKHAYLRHKVHRTISSLQYAPYEDVLGIGHAGGFTSILVPGAGEAHFDALEVNPFQTKSQRKEAEVKALLEKIQPEMICLDPGTIGDVNSEKLQSDLEAAASKLHVKPKKIDFEPRHKTKGKSGTVKKFHIRRTVLEQEKRKAVKSIMEEPEEREGPAKKPKKPKTLMDRLK